MFITAYNYHNLPSEVIQEEVSDELIVEPSDSYTIRELIYRLAMGMPVNSSVRSGEYPDEDQDFDDDLPTERGDFDLADYAQMSEELRSKYRVKVEEKKEPEKPKEEPKEEPKAEPVSTSEQSS
nr:MAG TPA: hypothetical protein [Microviridae sp.]